VKARLSPTLVGIFVLGALALGVVALFAFGDAALFTRPQRFVVYVDESAHGLDPGASVKLRGVRVGRVVEVNVRADPAAHRAEVEVVCEISKNVMFDPAGRRVDFSAEGVLTRLVEQGLRAELAVASLATGLLYVDLGFHDPALQPAPERPPGGTRYPVVPAVPSAISEFTASLTGLLGKLQQVDYVGLSQDLRGLLAATRARVDALQLQPVLDEIAAAAAAVRSTAGDPAILGAFAALDRTLVDLRALLATLDNTFAPAGEDLRVTMQEARAAMQQFATTAEMLRRLVGPQSGLGEETLRALAEIGDAARSLRRLMELLERNPRSLLTGPPVEVDPAAPRPSLPVSRAR
jgi:paraquat-inducible protein B